MAFSLPALAYAYDALEPHIDARTMEIHHLKHHQTYVNNANATLEKYPEWLAKTPGDILTHLDKIPSEVRNAARNNVGGVCNHSFFWTILSPKGGEIPKGKLKNAIEKTFGSFEKFKEEFKKASLGQFGSGWAWLVIKDGALSIVQTSNQDSVLTLGYKRILGIDIWEHAYYLHYQNRRPDYVDAFWNVVNWDKCEEYFEKGGT